MAVVITGAAPFETWMRMVDTRIRALAWGMTSMDLPDMDWREWYDSGVPVRDAADMALEEAGFPGEGDY